MKCVALVIVVAFASTSGCGDESPPQQDHAACQRLRDHVVDLRVAEVDQDRDAHRDALKRALGTEFMARCESQPRSRFDCEMKATNIDGLRSCATSEQP